MNITQALNVALPEMPAKMVSQRYPRVHPNVVFKEHIEEGQPVVRVFLPGEESLLFTFSEAQWKLIRLFDGQRSYADVAQLYSRETGFEYSEDTVKQFAADTDAINFWYKTPLEKNVKLMQKTADERRRLQKKKNKWGDLSHDHIPGSEPGPVPDLALRENRVYLQAVVRRADAAGLCLHRRSFHHALERGRPGHVGVLQLCPQELV